MVMVAINNIVLILQFQADKSSESTEFFIDRANKIRIVCFFINIIITNPKPKPGNGTYPFFYFSELNLVVDDHLVLANICPFKLKLMRFHEYYCQILNSSRTLC